MRLVARHYRCNFSCPGAICCTGTGAGPCTLHARLDPGLFYLVMDGCCFLSLCWLIVCVIGGKNATEEDVTWHRFRPKFQFPMNVEVNRDQWLRFHIALQQESCRIHLPVCAHQDRCWHGISVAFRKASSSLVLVVCWLSSDATRLDVLHADIRLLTLWSNNRGILLMKRHQNQLFARARVLRFLATKSNTIVAKAILGHPFFDRTTMMSRNCSNRYLIANAAF